jgi:hypothetical protein
LETRVGGVEREREREGGREGGRKKLGVDGYVANFQNLAQE